MLTAINRLFKMHTTKYTQEPSLTNRSLHMSQRKRMNKSRGVPQNSAMIMQATINMMEESRAYSMAYLHKCDGSNLSITRMDNLR